MTKKKNSVWNINESKCSIEEHGLQFTVIRNKGIRMAKQTGAKYIFLLESLEYWIAVKVRQIKAWSEGCKKAFVHCAIYCLQIDVVNYCEWMPLLYPATTIETTTIALAAPTVSKIESDWIRNIPKSEMYIGMLCVIRCTWSFWIVSRDRLCHSKQ